MKLLHCCCMPLFALALFAFGAGANAQGELGDGTTSDRAAFVSVVGFGEAIGSPVAGEGHTCSLTSGGRVACWGTNTAGELGDNTTTERSTPVYVTTS